MLAAQKAAAAKKRDAEEAAKLVSDFAASHANPRAQSFVRGATLGGNVPVPADKKPGAAAAAAPVAAAGKAYNPLGPPSSGMGMFADASEVEPSVVKKPAAKKRNIDSFLAELKSTNKVAKTAVPPPLSAAALAAVASHSSSVAAMVTTVSNTSTGSRAPALDSAATTGAAFVPVPFASLSSAMGLSSMHPVLQQVGGAGAHDPNTTNIYLGNLHPDITEQVLMMEFGKFGPIGSVKIMWPRTEEQKAVGRHCGFVSYLHRPFAEQAIIHLQDASICGQKLHISWGKACDIPSSHLPSVGIPCGWDPKPWEVAGVHQSLFALPGNALRIDVHIPSSSKVCETIDLLATAVDRHGHFFEKFVMDNEEDNSEFFFLFELDTTEHVYYRWRLYSLSQGDSLTRWRTTPFQMNSTGPMWYPPIPPDGFKSDALSSSSSLTSARSAKSEVAPVVVDKTLLSTSEREEWELLLRKLSTERANIRAGMVFALDHVQQAKEIVSILVDALTLSETGIPKKLARLYLVSDILHNTSTPSVRGASIFRSEFQLKLRAIFLSLHELFSNTSGRLAAESFKDKVVRVLRVWQAWSVFPTSLLEDLECLLMKGLTVAEDKAAAIAAAAAATNPELDGIPLSASGNAADDDIDGIPL